MQMSSYVCCIRTLPPNKCERGDVHKQGLLRFLYIYTSLFSHDCPGVCFILLQNIILHPRTFSFFGKLSCTQNISFPAKSFHWIWDNASKQDEISRLLQDNTQEKKKYTKNFTAADIKFVFAANNIKCDHLS